MAGPPVAGFKSVTDRATRGAARDFEKDVARCRTLFAVRDAFDRADEALDQEEALLVRFTDLGELIVRSKYLQEHGESSMKARYALLWRAEQQPLGIRPPAL